MNTDRHHLARRQQSETSAAQWLSLIVIAAFVIVPFYTTMTGGFKEIGELRTSPFGLPKDWNPVNFVEILTGPTLLRSLGNSLFVALSTVILTAVLASMAAFALVHIRFFGRRFVTGYILLGLLFPFATAILPLFIKLRDFGLLDSLGGVIVAQVAFGLSFSIVLFANFFRQLPAELFEAARMDGCGYLRIYWSITLPLSVPILATVSVFTFVSSWNNFLLPLIVLNADADYTWPLGIMQFQDEYSSNWPRILAYLTITIIPALAFFLIAQRYIVSGLTGGAVKG